MTFTVCIVRRILLTSPKRPCKAITLPTQVVDSSCSITSSRSMDGRWGETATRASSTHAETLAAMFAAASREPSLLATALSHFFKDSSTRVYAAGVVLCLGRKPRCFDVLVATSGVALMLLSRLQQLQLLLLLLPLVLQLMMVMHQLLLLLMRRQELV